MGWKGLGIEIGFCLNLDLHSMGLGYFGCLRCFEPKNHKHKIKLTDTSCHCLGTTERPDTSASMSALAVLQAAPVLVRGDTRMQLQIYLWNMTDNDLDDTCC